MYNVHCIYIHVRMHIHVRTYMYMYIHTYIMLCVFMHPMQDRAGTNSPLDFEVVGGSEYGSDIFVASVKSDSIPEKAGLMVGDLVRGWGVLYTFTLYMYFFCCLFTCTCTCTYCTLDAAFTYMYMFMYMYLYLYLYDGCAKVQRRR